MAQLRHLNLSANIASIRRAGKARLRHILPKRALKYYYKYYKKYEVALYGDSEVFALTQNRTFPRDMHHAEKIMVLLVPEHNAMSGGIYSIFSIANEMRRLKTHHSHEILVMTRPVPSQLTYFRNTNFRNSENVYRFEQILLCKAAKEIYLHIPEYATETFVDYISNDERRYLLSREKVHINILNQNISLMPDKERFSSLREVCGDISQSVAHHAYFNQAIADKYELPTLILPPYTDLSSYLPSDFDEKEKLIIYSPDEAPYKKECLERISRNLPNFELIEIRDITFDRFMDYATRCMFSITFGEGFDGYLAQPIHQGGIGFAAYDDRFFPARRFKRYENIFDDGEQLVRCICDRILALSQDRHAYQSLNAQWKEEYRKLYNYREYVDQVRRLSLKQFELLPHRTAFTHAATGELSSENWLERTGAAGKPIR